VSPILTRPVREQLEHDRVIRLLQARYKRKTEVIINPGSEKNQSVTVENLVVFPDVLIFAEGGKKLVGTVEVETGESVNPLEARADWARFAKLKAPFHLYVPAASVETAQRLIAEHDILVAELWSFHSTYDNQVRFTMIYRSPNAPVVKLGPVPNKPVAASKPVAAPVKVAPKPVAKPAAKPAAKAKAKLATKAKPAAKPAPKAKAKPAAKAKPVVKKASKPAAKKAKPTKPAAKKRR
jgi:hypothetical protein